MPESSPLPLQVVEALGRGWVVVTANQRAARTLRRAFELHQRARGLKSWTPPQILAWDSWLVSLYREMMLDGRATELLLNAAQEHTLWRAIVAEDASTNSLRPIDALAEAASTAWNLLHAYGGRSRLKSYAGNSDTRVFAAWAAAFERRLKQRQYISGAQLPERLRDAVLARDLASPAGVLLIGFDTTTPAQVALIEAWRSSGSAVELFAQERSSGNKQLVSAASDEEELHTCATWLRDRLGENRQVRLAVIVPAIESVRAELDRQFRAVLAPELNEIGSPATGPYEFSLGVPLAQTAMVGAAMDVLHWSQGPLSLDRVSFLLLSPYFASSNEEERLARAEFDAFVLRRQKLLQPQLGVDALHSLTVKSGNAIAVVAKHLGALRRAFGAPELPMLRTHGEWVETMSEMLSAAGWAGIAVLDSTEFQLRRKWDSALDELAMLDFEDQRVPFAQALASLEHIVQQTLFAPESQDAPVQIMGPLESAGTRFDGIWFLRANDVDWSTGSSPNPLLPWAMQRDLHMPGAIPTHDDEVARAITERIERSAPEVVFSYARESADGPQRPSPALLRLELERVDASSLVTRAREHPIPDVEILASEPAIPALPQIVLRGGSSVLEKQAACAFRAFAEARLFSTALDPAVLGLEDRERGSIVHSVLQLFWMHCQSQANLRAMPAEERDAVLDECIRDAIEKRRRTIDPGWSSAYIDAERQRLSNLLRPWLAYEAEERSAFVVKALEHEHKDVAIGPLHLNVKVDRVDTWLNQGEPGGEIILDYKTGVAKPSDWDGERPDAPQLPLYAVVTGSPELVGVAIASVRPGNGREIRGVAAQKQILPRAAVADLDTKVEEWRAVLTSLAEDFHAGKTDVQPKSYPDTCRYCQQRLLCRLDVAALSADQTEEEEVFIEEDHG